MNNKKSTKVRVASEIASGANTFAIMVGFDLIMIAILLSGIVPRGHQNWIVIAIVVVDALCLSYIKASINLMIEAIEAGADEEVGK